MIFAVIQFYSPLSLRGVATTKLIGIEHKKELLNAMYRKIKTNLINLMLLANIYTLQSDNI